MIPAAMEHNSLLPEEQDGLNKVDSAHAIIFDHWDHDNQKFKHPDQIEMEKEEAAEAKLIKDGPARQFTVPEGMDLNDWTGTKFAENILCYNKSPCPKPPVEYPTIVRQGDGALIQLHHSKTPGSDPMDPTLSDVQRIMDRYAAADKAKENPEAAAAEQEKAADKEKGEVQDQDLLEKDQVDRIFERYAKKDGEKALNSENQKSEHRQIGRAHV